MEHEIIRQGIQEVGLLINAILCAMVFLALALWCLSGRSHDP